jgi:hypothetical protein
MSMQQRSLVFARIATIARIVRDGWVVVGLSLGLLVGLEGALRGLMALRAWLAHAERAPSSQPEWMPEYLKEHDRAVQSLIWTSYVYFQTAPFTGRYINIDASGTRRTIQSVLPEDAPDVFLMGGSTLFGSYQRDAGTLPSMLARHMERCEGPRPRLHNFGQTGRVFTQEVIDLLLKLRAGREPKVVIFYDGINDVAAALQRGVPGLPINENHRVRDFEFGRDLFWWETTLSVERRAIGRLVMAGAERLQVLRLMRRYIPQRNATAPVDEVTGTDVIASYLGTARWVQALGREYGFVPVFVWQPTIQASRKPLTANEAALLRAVEAGPWGRRLIALHRDVAAKLEPTLAPALGSSFHDLTDVFNASSETIFVDDVGHTNERASELLADVLRPVLAQALNLSGVPLTCRAERAPMQIQSD